jgi:hypothetical protein
MKHTPGPWKAYPNGTICGGKYNTTQICETGWAFWSNRLHELLQSTPSGEEYDGNVLDFLHKNTETSTANAKLIAAAPDLLEACKCALADIQGLRELFSFEDSDNSPSWETIEELEKAITKATE